jgi:hypothetical protein
MGSQPSQPGLAIVPILLLSLAIFLQFALAAVSGTLIKVPGGKGRLRFAALCVSLTGTVFLIPAEKPLLRFLGAMTACTLGTKLYDVRHDLLRGQGPGPREYLAFLVNPFTQVRRKLPSEPRPSRASDLRRLSVTTCLLAAGIPLFRCVFGADWSGVPFLAEHTVKLFAFYLPLISGLLAGSSLWRLLGGSARDHMDHPFLARTPADFWRRYNRCMQQFFVEDVFLPGGGTLRSGRYLSSS